MIEAATPGLVHKLGISAAKAAPPTLVTVYAMLSKGLPFVISFLTLVYLSIQIAHLSWTWLEEVRRKPKGTP